jgi:hypothetical protein
LQLQSIAWAVLAFLGLALYTCELQVTYEQTNSVYYLYFVYFFSEYVLKTYKRKELTQSSVSTF